MNFNLKRGLGLGFLFAGIFIISTARVITGSVVGLQKENLLGLVGLVVFVVGILVLFSSRKEKPGGLENEANKSLKQRNILIRPHELISLAKRMGYTLTGGGNHPTHVYKNRQLVTVIPGHSTVNRYTAQGIMKRLRDDYST